MVSWADPRTRHHLRELLLQDERPLAQRERLIDLMVLLATLPPPPDPVGLMPNYGALHEQFLTAADGSDGEALEERFLELYCQLHGHAAPYTAAERIRVNQTGGYWCHAGGLGPIMMAQPYIQRATRSADFGAGNGLQGLLLQKLYPHEHTLQIEISSQMVVAGRALQQWLAIPDERVTWRCADVCEISARGLDFIYLYRPLKPVGTGQAFYQRFVAELAAERRAVTIFSVADCLRNLLPADFAIVYDDGHLCCFRRGSDVPLP